MKVIKSETGFLVYQKIFKQLMATHSEIILWQVVKGEREITKCKVGSFHLETGNLHFEINDFSRIQRNLPLYCYSENGQLIFKTQILAIRDNNFSVRIPLEIKLLGSSEYELIKGQLGLDLEGIWKTKKLKLDLEDEGLDYMKVKSMAQRTDRDQTFLRNEFNSLSADDEEKLFAEQRDSPRAKPKVEKYVKLSSLLEDGSNKFRLLDLSQSGMGFLTPSKEAFQKGQEIVVMGFDDHVLDDPLIGKVMSIKSLNDSANEYKVGVMFSDGQN